MESKGGGLGQKSNAKWRQCHVIWDVQAGVANGRLQVSDSSGGRPTAQLKCSLFGTFPHGVTLSTIIDRSGISFATRQVYNINTASPTKFLQSVSVVFSPVEILVTTGPRLGAGELCRYLRAAYHYLLAIGIAPFQ